jgi:hypothetical protein
LYVRGAAPPSGRIMATVLRRLLKVPPTRPLLELEADWSAISPAGLGLVFKELLADFMGAPPPPDVLSAREFYKRAWKTANISDIYFQHRHLVGIIPQGFLVRGIVYDMPSLIQKEVAFLQFNIYFPISERVFLR